MENALLSIVVIPLVLILVSVAATLYLLLRDQPRKKSDICFAEISEAYCKRNGKAYTKLLRRALGEAHRLLPADCVLRQAELVRHASAHGFDGLESLWLMYQDCAAASRDPHIMKQRVENARRFKKGYHYKGPPAPQLPQRVARWNSLMERAVRGEALRVVLAHFAKLRPEDSEHMNHSDLLAQREVRANLCELPLRRNQYGAVALSELLRQGQCLLQRASGGTFGVNQLCQELEAGGARISEALEAMSRQEVDRLSEFCGARAAGSGLSGVGFDALDGFASDLCVTESTNDLADYQSVAQLMADCYSDPEANPFAGEAGGEAEDDREGGFGGEDEPRGEDESEGGEGEEGGDAEDGGGSGSGEGEEAANAEEDGDSGSGEGRGSGSSEEGGGQWQVAVVGDTMDVTYTSPEGNIYGHVEPLDPDNPDASFVSAQMEIEAQVQTYGDTNVEPTEDNTTVYDSGNQPGSSDEDAGDAETSPGGEGSNAETSPGGEGSNAETSPGGEGGDAETSPDGIGGSFDPNNPACQQLVKMGLLSGGRQADFWSEFFGRAPYHVRAGTINPSPDAPDADPGAGEMACGPTGGDSLAGARCNSFELCAEGSVYDENCRCVAVNRGTLKASGCVGTRCPNGTTAVPIGMNQCVCSSDEPEELIGAPGAGPLPDPMVDPRSELLWNRTAADRIPR